MVIPPNKPSQRADQLDRVVNPRAKSTTPRFRTFASATSGQPVLVGTTSIENSEIIAKLLKKEGLPHQVLNAKQHAREAEIVAQAGRPKMITIATNMAGPVAPTSCWAATSRRLVDAAGRRGAGPIQRPPK